MTLAQRISIARTLTIIQIVLSAVFVIAASIVAIVFVTHGLSEASAWFRGMSNGVGVGIAMVAFVAIFALVLVTALPAIVLVALKKRKEQWGTAAVVSLIVQIVLGGGLFSLFPIVTLILLLNKEASAYIGLK
ncbi:MAG: hypothetical protein WCT28_03425 [Patescibacteria group bacterium]|jgi:cytochrome bd-type quinol oxidase subunit 2